MYISNDIIFLKLPVSLYSKYQISRLKKYIRFWLSLNTASLTKPDGLTERFEIKVSCCTWRSFSIAFPPLIIPSYHIIILHHCHHYLLSVYGSYRCYSYQSLSFSFRWSCAVVCSSEILGFGAFFSHFLGRPKMPGYRNLALHVLETRRRDTSYRWLLLLLHLLLS